MNFQVFKQARYRRFTRNRAGSAMYFFFIFLGGLFSILPLIYCICTAFKPLDELLVFPPRFFVYRPTLQNFKDLPLLLEKLQVPLSRYVFNSLFISVISTFLQILAASAAAFAFSKSKLKGTGIIFTVIQLSLLYNAYTLAVPQYLIFSEMQLIDTYLVYILPTIASSMGVFLIKQYMDSSIPDSLLEAARIDGASIYKIYWRIVMPITKPAWMTLVLFAFQAMWSTVPNGTIFSEELKTLPYALSSIAAGGIARSGSTMAVTVILMIPPIVVYFISQSNVMETMSTAGMKG